MTKIYFSYRTKTFTHKVFEALLTVAYQEKGDRDKKIKLKCEWSSARQIKFEIGKADLKKLIGNATEHQFDNEIQPALVGYLPKILGILTETGDPTGSGMREFSLDLWDEDKDKNLKRFDEEWDKKHNEHKKSKPKSSKSSRTATPATTPLPQQRQLFGATQIRDIPDWVGREELLTELHADFANGRKVLVLCGQGGIGKTSLAVKLMAACGVDKSRSILPTTCPYDNALYCEVNDADNFDSLIAKFLTAFGMRADREGATPAQVIELILTRLHKERWLVTIDNLESLMESDSSKSKSPDVRNLLNCLAYGGHNSQIIITSRKLPDDLADRRGTKIDFSVVRAENLQGILDADSVRLLKDLGAKDSYKDLEWIAGRVRGNIFVLKLLADYSRKQPGILRKKPELVTKEAKPIVRAQWELQGAPAQDLLQRMCVLRIAMDVSALTTLRLLRSASNTMEFTPEAEAATEDLLTVLVKSDLVQDLYDESLCESRYVLHPLMAETLQDIFADDLERLWQYAAGLYGSFATPEEFRDINDWQWSLEKLHFWWLLEMYEDVSEIVIKSLISHLGQWGYWSLQKEWGEKVLPHLENIDRRNCLQILGTVCRNIGQWDNSKQFYQKSLELCIEMQDRSGIASSWAYLGYVAYQRGKWDEAEELYEKSLDIYTKTSDLAGIAKVYGLLANIARDQEMWQKAREFIQKCLNIEIELNDRSGMAASWGFMGEMARMQGQWDEAEQLLHKYLNISIELDNRWGIVDSWGCLGENELDRGNLESAEIWLTQSLKGRDDLQMLWGVAETTYNLARLYQAKGDEPQAQAHYEISHGLYTKLGAKKELERIERAWNTDQ